MGKIDLDSVGSINKYLNHRLNANPEGKLMKLNAAAINRACCYTVANIFEHWKRTSKIIWDNKQRKLPFHFYIRSFWLICN